MKKKITKLLSSQNEEDRKIGALLLRTNKKYIVASILIELVLLPIAIFTIVPLFFTIGHYWINIKEEVGPHKYVFLHEMWFTKGFEHVSYIETLGTDRIYPSPSTWFVFLIFYGLQKLCKWKNK